MKASKTPSGMEIPSFAVNDRLGLPARMRMEASVESLWKR